MVGYLKLNNTNNFKYDLQLNIELSPSNGRRLSNIQAVRDMLYRELDEIEVDMRFSLEKAIRDMKEKIREQQRTRY